MQYIFKPCVNRTACTEDGTHCRSCGRSHEEIAKTRQLVEQVKCFLIEMNYENHEDFLAYLNRKVAKKISMNKS